MSFILEALKKSEKERQNGALPKVTSEHRPGPSDKRRLWPYLAATALVLNVAGLAVLFWFPQWLPISPSRQPAPSHAVPAAGTADMPKAAAGEAAKPRPPAPETKTAALAPPAKPPAAEPVAKIIPPPPEPETTVPEAKISAPAPDTPGPAPAEAAATPPTPEPPAPEPLPVPEPPAPAAAFPEPAISPLVTPSAASPPPRKPAPPARKTSPAVQVASARPDRRDASGFVRRGRAFEQQGLYDRAIEEYTQAILADPTRAEAYFGRGWSHEAKGGHLLAIDDYSSAIRLRPDFADAYVARAWAYEQQGQAERAIDEYGHAIRIQPGNSGPYMSRGILRFYDGRLEAAAEDFSAVLDIADAGTRRFSALWLFLARAHAGADGTKELTAFAERVDLDPWPGIVASLYLGNATPGQVLAATVHADPERQRQNECVAYYFLGQYHLVRGEDEEAAAYFRKALDTGVTAFRQYGAAKEELRRMGRL